ncbi:aldose 1-epimerase [Pararhizobium sp. BT-229]|uniref:aldose 1-epimerase n=1 Tax=Pararhizobium sp. BT-229 TaxID=2986923 RepID=UPI0021F7A32D|nr:aldose 1-epimerase [Pararhizobium sp. BT-229]MCV9961747.1 aldose 1-epimerase [Pararhizobium sp. BT-229]
MTVVDLTSGNLSARISTGGGIVLGLWWERDNGRIPLLREAPRDDADALASGCYPLVPFGNRVKDNRFRFNGRDCSFKPNTDWDKHYLHGEGWQANWSIEQQTSSSLELSFNHAADGKSPYAYAAIQRFALQDDAFELTLSVTNRGGDPLPFGLGWHPYFPMTPKTTLFAPARKYWTEVEDWLPGEATEIPADVDFSKPRGLPHHWVNNGFEGWCGEAQIVWPERRARLSLTADPLFRHAFVFVSDTSFDPAFKRDYFCFEPMSHLANGHNLPGLGDLAVLEPGETLTGSICMKPAIWTDQ